MKAHEGRLLYRQDDKPIVQPPIGDSIEVHVFPTMEDVVKRQMKRGTIYYFRNGTRWCVSIRGPKKK